MRPVVVIPAAPQHGVTRFARLLAEAVAAADGVAGAPLSSVPARMPVHVQFTDRLWGDDPDAAAAAIERVAARHPLTVTLHDVPQPSDGPVGMGRRRAAYARVVRAARGIAVSSDHERRLLVEHGVAEVAAVVAHPIASAVPGRVDVGRDVAVLGFYYPGKGHDEALAAAISAGADGVTVLGRVSPGHEPDLEAFVRRADAAGMPVEVTGYLSDDELHARARRAGVPFVGHRHMSASGSLGAWLEAGRLPVTVRNRYTEEHAARHPGTIALADDLGTAVAMALADADSTWLSPDATPRWGWADAARAYRDWWAALP